MLEAENIPRRKITSTEVLLRALFSLDYVLEHPELAWLPTEREKVRCFETLGLHRGLLPSQVYQGGGEETETLLCPQAPHCRGFRNRHLCLHRSRTPNQQWAAFLGGDAPATLGSVKEKGFTGASGGHCIGPTSASSGRESAAVLGEPLAGKGGSRTGKADPGRSFGRPGKWNASSKPFSRRIGAYWQSMGAGVSPSIQPWNATWNWRNCPRREQSAESRSTATSLGGRADSANPMGICRAVRSAG